MTSTRRHYKNAPIIEAVIDIQIEAVRGATLDDVTELADQLKDEFPVRLPVFQLQMGFQATDSNATPSFRNEKENLGWRLMAKSEPRVLQLRTNGFTYSHLPPYSNWQTFSAEAQALWSRYVEKVGPQTAKRLAVRVINKLPILDSDGAMDEILDIFPSLPDGLPRDVRGLSLSVQLAMKEIDDHALLNLALYTSPVAPSETGLLLDIDIFVERQVPIDSQVFDILDRIGLAKDDVFEACIKDRIRERIQ